MIRRLCLVYRLIPQAAAKRIEAVDIPHETKMDNCIDAKWVKTS
jgi:hypothetical protein